MEVKQVFIGHNNERCYEQEYSKGKPIFKELIDNDGNYIFDVSEITDHQWFTGIRLGHIELPDNYDERECFEAAINLILKREMYDAKK